MYTDSSLFVFRFEDKKLLTFHKTVKIGVVKTVIIDKYWGQIPLYWGQITLNWGQYRQIPLNWGQYSPIQPIQPIPYPYPIPHPTPIPHGHPVPHGHRVHHGPTHHPPCPSTYTHTRLPRPRRVHQASFVLKTRSHADNLGAIFGFTVKSDKTRLHSNRVLQKCTVLHTIKTKQPKWPVFDTFAPTIEKMGHWPWGMGLLFYRKDEKTGHFLQNREEKTLF